MDAWELAQWFSDPNQWLHGARPADLIRSNPFAVIQAARADRFIMAG
jgi:hypothetical protein